MSSEHPEVSEAVRLLTATVLQRIQQEMEVLGGVALRDAKLDPKDGWRYDPQNAVYVRS